MVLEHAVPFSIRIASVLSFLVRLKRAFLLHQNFDCSRFGSGFEEFCMRVQDFKDCFFGIIQDSSEKKKYGKYVWK